ncbi:hypothetical protein [Corynebacterium glyciniphilum]|uniref:hypothetical protein n=1 Tax=Corynebacterium glyciniphilum TaxID=1404244 RepID=UPI003DA0F72B
MNATTMRSPWERLRADRPPSTTLVFVLLIVVMAFLTSSTLVQFHRGWQPWPAVTGGIFFPALSVLMLLPNPARYRVVGLSMRQWVVDHGMLVALVTVIHLAWPVWAVARPVDDAEQVPVWMPVLPAVAVLGVVALVLCHHRHVLSGRVVGTGARFSGMPLHYHVFLARRGPVAWRTVCQPVGLTALVTVVVILIWRTYDADNPDPDVATSSFLFAALITAPVVAASRSTAMAVGLPRRDWVMHTLAAISVPQLVLGLPFAFRLAEVNPHVSTEPVRLVIYVGIVLTSALVAAAFAVSLSYEDWGTAIAWLIGFGFVFMVVGAFGFGASGALWPNLLALAGNVLLAWCLVSYARGKALLGQPDWTMTSIIGGPRQRRNRLGS